MLKRANFGEKSGRKNFLYERKNENKAHQARRTGAVNGGGGLGRGDKTLMRVAMRIAHLTCLTVLR